MGQEISVRPRSRGCDLSYIIYSNGYTCTKKNAIDIVIIPTIVYTKLDNRFRAFFCFREEGFLRFHLMTIPFVASPDIF